ncbi:glycosyltransferase family 2 protein [Chitinophagaceae bacterium MMS25-I14]
MIQISAIIITYNEERNIARCIESLQGVADEIIVVDSYSKDNTVAIAQKEGARVVQHPFNGYGEQKSFANSQASYNWVLNLDADEALSPELKKSILDIKEQPDADAYDLNILTYYCGKWIRHCGWYPNPKLRFWDKTKGYMKEDKVHEGWHLDNPEGKIRLLPGDVLHYSYYTISDHLKKIEQYSEIGARFDVERGKKCSFLKLVFAPKWEFLALFLLRGGVLDGYYGYLLCRNSAYASFVKYQKIRQYTELKKQGIGF